MKNLSSIKDKHIILSWFISIKIMVSVLSSYLDFIVYLLVFILNYTNLVYFQLSLKSKNILQSQPFFYVFILKNKNVL